MYLCCPTILAIDYSLTSPHSNLEHHYYYYCSEKTSITYNFPQSSINSTFSYALLYNFIQMYINARWNLVPTILIHCIIIFIIYGSMFSLMKSIYSRNMQLVFTQIKLCLECDFASFFVLLLCVQMTSKFTEEFLLLFAGGEVQTCSWTCAPKCVQFVM